MNENLKYFATLQDANGYVINDIPWVGYIEETDQVLYCQDPRKMIIIQNNHAIIYDVVDVIFETLNDADGYIIETTPWSCYIKENQQMLQTTDSYYKISVENTQAKLIDAYLLIRYTATSKINMSSIGQVRFDVWDNTTNKGVAVFNSIYHNFFGNSQFLNNANLTSIIIPEFIKIIYDYAFCQCTSLTSVTIPNSVTSIKSHAFEGCTGLSSISYTGTISQYNSITKGDQWHRNVPATQVYCLGENPPAYTPI